MKSYVSSTLFPLIFVADAAAAYIIFTEADGLAFDAVTAVNLAAAINKEKEKRKMI